MPTDSIIPLSRNRLGPVTSTKASSIIARPMLKFDSRLMPLSRPRATEMPAMTVTTAMRAIWMMPDSSRPKSCARPALIWSVPSPTDVATPKIVPMIATTSIVLPMGP